MARNESPPSRPERISSRSVADNRVVTDPVQPASTPHPRITRCTNAPTATSRPVHRTHPSATSPMIRLRSSDVGRGIPATIRIPHHTPSRSSRHHLRLAELLHVILRIRRRHSDRSAYKSAQRDARYAGVRVKVSTICRTSSSWLVASSDVTVRSHTTSLGAATRVSVAVAWAPLAPDGETHLHGRQRRPVDGRDLLRRPPGCGGEALRVGGQPGDIGDAGLRRPPHHEVAHAPGPVDPGRVQHPALGGGRMG